MNIKSVVGLSSSEASRRLTKFGLNQISHDDKKSFWTLLWQIVSEPMLLLLLVTVGIYLFIGEINDSLMLGSGALIIILITFYQEQRTQKAVDRLKELSIPRARVYRDGKAVLILSSDIVPGDLVEIHEGDRVIADGVLLEQVNMLVDESVLTGESIGVRKVAGDMESTMTKPGGDDQHTLYSGTVVLRGYGLLLVIATGDKTEIGKIGRSLATIEEEESLIKQETKKMIKIFALVAIFLCLVLVGILGFVNQDWTNAFLSGLALSMALIPEEFPVVMVIFLTIGALRISKKNVLARRGEMIETLGAIDVLCVDKTGTITTNEQSLSMMYTDGSLKDYRNHKKSDSFPEKFHTLMEYALLASHDDSQDPIELEIFEQAKKIFGRHDHIHESWVRSREYPITSNLVATSNVWKSRHNSEWIVATKGAPETIMKLCDLNKDQKNEVLAMVKKLANDGLRVIAIAKASSHKIILPKSQSGFDFNFLGLLAFYDPIRKSVPNSIKSCHRAGIRVILITGDYPITALRAAQDIDIVNYSEYLTGDDLDKMNHLDLREKIKTVSVFARIVPEQKLMIVNALKANGLVVAMTGDGVNDAPALKAANVGISMGKRGTEVSRESSDMILMNDDFTSIVHAIKLGRQIFDNLNKAMSFIFSVHFPIAGMSLFPVLFGLPPLLFPAHIAFMELIIDPSCSTVFESIPAEKDTMLKNPRDLSKPLFGGKAMFLSTLMGISFMLLMIIYYFLLLRSGFEVNLARTMVFTTVIFGDLVLIVTNLTTKNHLFSSLKNFNLPLYLVIGLSMVILWASIKVPFLREVFMFTDINMGQLGGSLLIALVLLVVFELQKFSFNKFYSG